MNYVEKQDAVIAVDERIEQIQKLWREIVDIADYCGMRVDFQLETEIDRGYNKDTNYVCWSASSQNCG